MSNRTYSVGPKYYSLQYMCYMNKNPDGPDE